MHRKLAKYEIREEIGHGGMATVYRAHDTRLDRPVALKIMHPHLQAAHEARVRFAREARSVAKLKHPNILDIYDYSGEESEESYIAAELLTGPTLRIFGETTPEIPAEVAACITIELARALSAAHAAGVIHRDVKPENVLLHEDRMVKLTDFGIAQMVGGQSFTATGQILGSPGHMAPEQVEGADCDARTDIFSLGTVLYFLAVGRLPFSGRNPHHVLKRIMDGEYLDPLRARPTIGGRMRAIIVKSLAHDPDDRYQTAAELEQDLIELIAEVGIEDPTEMLATYLGNPKGTAAELREQSIKALTVAGRKAAETGDLPTALDHFNRVLALDDGNAEVLRLLAGLGRRARLRSVLTAAGIVLGVFGLAGIGWAAFSGASGHGDTPVPRDPVAGAALAAQHPETPSPPSVAHTSHDAPATIAAAQPSGAGHGSTPLPDGHDAHASPGHSHNPSTPRPSQPRLVVFRPTPQNVAISVDGAPPRPFGPSFRETELRPGPHHFKLVGGAGCCIDADFSVTIPPGQAPFVIQRTLGYRPAYVYVISNVAADVEVEGGVHGRSREIIQVPLEGGAVEARQITVTAPGHRRYTGTVRLQAGRDTQVQVTLLPSGSPP